MTLSQKLKKKKHSFFGHCSFTQLFHDVEKLRRKYKICVKVIQRFCYVQHMDLIFLKNPPEAAKVATSVKFFNVGKTKACFPHQDFEIKVFFNSV